MLTLVLGVYCVMVIAVMAIVLGFVSDTIAGWIVKVVRSWRT